MKAFVVARYGKNEVRLADVPAPAVGSSDVLVKVSAASINPLDSMVRNGDFKQLLKYKLNRPGMSGDSTSWEGWSHARWFVEEVSAGAT